MSYATMAKEIQGDIPGIPLPKAQTLVQEALGLIYDEQRWSFQIVESGWLAHGMWGRQNLPGQDIMVSPGTISVEPFSSTVYGSESATIAWGKDRRHRPFITEQQIRVPQYGLYNIIQYFPPGEDPEDPDSEVATLRLDRPWMEPEQNNVHYMIYQAYFPVPEGFRGFATITDMTFNSSLDFQCHDQTWLNQRDPQRLSFDVPRHAIPYQIDTRPFSSTRGQMLYELWPHPLARMPYRFTCRIAGPPLKRPEDVVPYPLNEELVKFRARELGSMWKESQLADGLDRGSGADWRFLAQFNHEQYNNRLKTVKLLDQQLGDLYWSKFDCACRGRRDEDWEVGGIAVLPGPPCPEPPPQPPPPPEPPPIVDVLTIFGGVGSPGATADVNAVGTTAVLSTGDILSMIQEGAESDTQSFGPFIVVPGQVMYLLLASGAHTWFVDATSGNHIPFAPPIAVSFVAAGGTTFSLFLYASSSTLSGTFRPEIAVKPVDTLTIFGGLGLPGATSVSSVGQNALLDTGDQLPAIQQGAEYYGQIFGPYNPVGQVIYLLLAGSGSLPFVNVITNTVMNFTVTPVQFTAQYGTTFNMFLYQSEVLTGEYAPEIGTPYIPPPEQPTIFVGVGTQGAIDVTEVLGAVGAISGAQLDTGDVLAAAGGPEVVNQVFGPFSPTNQVVYLLLTNGGWNSDAQGFVNASGFVVPFNPPIPVTVVSPSGAEFSMFLYATTMVQYMGFSVRIVS